MGILNDSCPHPEAKWKDLPCGHRWCELCGGYVDTITRVALNDGGPIITCNRKKLPWVEYDYIFREWFAGSARLTKAMQVAMVAIARRRGTDARAAWQKVARPRDILYDAKYMDLRVKGECGAGEEGDEGPFGVL